MYRVTCGVIRNDNDEILVVQRGGESDHPGKWEFPGGKVEEGESDEDCLIREIDEELGIDIIICAKLPEVYHDYGFKRINLVPFVCDTLDEKPSLTEHDAYRWLNAQELAKIELCEADIKVAEHYLSKFNGSTTVVEPRRPVSIEPTDYSTDIHKIIDKLKSSREAEWVASSAVEEPLMVEKLIEYSLGNDSKLAFHASWTLGKAYDTDKTIIDQYLNFLVDKVLVLDKDSVIRSFLRMISCSEIKDVDAALHGSLADFCFNNLRSASRPVAIRVHAMEILYNLTTIYPELSNELGATISVVMNEGSGAMKARGRMVMKKLKVF